MAAVNFNDIYGVVIPDCRQSKENPNNPLVQLFVDQIPVGYVVGHRKTYLGRFKYAPIDLAQSSKAKQNAGQIEIEKSQLAAARQFVAGWRKLNSSFGRARFVDGTAVFDNNLKKAAYKFFKCQGISAKTITALSLKGDQLSTEDLATAQAESRKLHDLHTRVCQQMDRSRDHAKVIVDSASGNLLAKVNGILQLNSHKLPSQFAAHGCNDESLYEPTAEHMADTRESLLKHIRQLRENLKTHPEHVRLSAAELNAWEKQINADKIDGDIDFAFSSEDGVALVADGTGHFRPEMKIHWKPQIKKFWEKLTTGLKGQVFANRKEAEGCIAKIANAARDGVGFNGSGSLIILVNIEGKKQLLQVQAGDTRVYVLRKSGAVERHGNECGQFPPQGMQDWKSHMRWIDVEDGDVVFGMSDGVHEFLPEEMLAALFKKRLSPDVFHKAVCDLIKTSPVAEDEPRNNPNRKKRFDASCPRHSDDVSTFVVTI